ncbi:MAG: PPC domain-containing protein, partial [Verrucomicrobia bacterium]|nr:PPC domain-containing protein [Verrucomicrobiota bacterium]
MARLPRVCRQAIGFRPRLRAGCLALVAALAFTPSATAQATGQRATSRIGYAYPAGGQQGTTTTVALGGQNLNGATAAYFSGTGVQAKVIGYDRPLTQKELNDAREKIQQLQDKRAATRHTASDSAAMPAKPVWTADDEKTLADLRLMIAMRQNRQINPALAETVTLEVTLAPDATPGEREVRLKTPAGLSNPLVYCVGQLPEFSEPAVSATSQPAPAGPNRYSGPSTRRSRPPMAITLPATVNGQVLPGETDRFQFSARQGQRLTVSASARALIPYLADAVPGWFQATLALYDGKGREVAYDDDFRFNPDPVLSYAIPADGDYTIEIKDSIYRGREDFVYRIAIGELPFVTSVFPLGSGFQDRASFEIAGWNLPLDQLSMETKNKSPGTFLLSVRNQGVLSNPVRFALDTQPDCREAEPNETSDTAQPLELPMIVNGRIDRAGDEDVFRFAGKAGSEFIAEIFARRLSSPLDSVLKLTDASGRQLAFNDDYEDKGAGLTTHHADSRLSVTLPADGAYYVRVADAQH